MARTGVETWDVAVIGGGPAGMMAAGRAAEIGARVVLIEKNEELGKKLLLTGGGRCNLTNNEPDVRKLLANFKESGKFLFSAFAQFGMKETFDFFEKRGLKLKTEERGRVFPEDDRSESVFELLKDYMRKGRVAVLTGDPVKDIVFKDNEVKAVILRSGKEIKARSFVLATGGKSHPETGSTGDGFVWLRKLGHSVAEADPSLVPLAIRDVWVRALQGVVVDKIRINLFQNDKKYGSKNGRVLFTHFGVSGPTIINLSQEVSEMLKYGEVILSLDIFPDLGHGDLNAKIQALIDENKNKKLANVLGKILPAAALADPMMSLSGIGADKFCRDITREERLKLIDTLKGSKMRVKGLLGKDKAIITRGGVSPLEVDFRTMGSRLLSNLYLVGDILDIDRPSGGYSLQLCWTTGFVAGTAAVGEIR